MKMDWPALMRAGLCHLRLQPAAFWALTPAELRLMLGDGQSATPMTREGLATLEAAFAARKDKTDG